MTIDKQALLGPDKHSNQHKLSRLIAEANSAEIRDIAEAVEQYTDQLIAALEAAEKRIAEQREYYEGVISDGSKRIAELEARTVVVKQFDDFQIVHYGATEDYAKGYIDCQSNYNKAIRAAGIKVKGE
ncbi:ead/Ea22-like family protein [Salmonella enterica]|nr:ead/Ea22-like family protein [Salmonella enterica]ECF5976988.1 ead/Ea22-like family protein [Salmonella enterica subsp. arizonae]EDU8175511.1 ead/Ea22-like family protein [Salmonella enterica subsp. arizonae serovar 41:z4,z23:-]EDS3056606.1 ead/Ea22-like family protein [Salmonella enterica]EGJ3794319.1 ead/Ea22-like family protein [Salmonella enterica]